MCTFHTKPSGLRHKIGCLCALGLIFSQTILIKNLNKTLCSHRSLLLLLDKCDFTVLGGKIMSVLLG